jgi:hypothetical protein
MGLESDGFKHGNGQGLIDQGSGFVLNELQFWNCLVCVVGRKIFSDFDCVDFQYKAILGENLWSAVENRRIGVV